MTVYCSVLYTVYADGWVYFSCQKIGITTSQYSDSIIYGIKIFFLLLDFCAWGEVFHDVINCRRREKTNVIFLNGTKCDIKKTACTILNEYICFSTGLIFQGVGSSKHWNEGKDGSRPFWSFYVEILLKNAEILWRFILFIVLEIHFMLVLWRMFYFVLWAIALAILWILSRRLSKNLFYENLCIPEWIMWWEARISCRGPRPA